jgi:hypothetical protein
VHLLADASVMVPNGAFVAITVAVVFALGLQVWALAETASRRRWVWLAAIWVTFPIGTIAWLTYGRWRPVAGTE